MQALLKHKKRHVYEIISVSFFVYKKTDGRYPSVCFYYFALTASLAFATILSAQRPYSLRRSTAGPE